MLPVVSLANWSTRFPAIGYLPRRAAGNGRNEEVGQRTSRRSVIAVISARRLYPRLVPIMAKSSGHRRQRLHRLPPGQRRWLAEGDEVTCLVRKTSPTDRLQSLGVRLAYGDITDRESLAAAVAGQEVVFQLAGCLRALRVEQLFRVNEEGVRNVARPVPSSPRRRCWWRSLAGGRWAGPDGRPRAKAIRRRRSRTTGGASGRASRPCARLGRPRAHHHRAAADRLRRGATRPGGDLRADRPLRYPPGARAGRTLRSFSVIHADDLVHLLILAAQRGRRLQSPATDEPAAGRQGCYFAACEENPTYAELGRMIGCRWDAAGRGSVRAGPVTVWMRGLIGKAMSHVFAAGPGISTWTRPARPRPAPGSVRPRRRSRSWDSPWPPRCRSGSDRRPEWYRWRMGGCEAAGRRII